MRTDSPRVSQFLAKRIHFIGIGGSGMSGLANMLLDSGAIVSGSEPKPSSLTRALAARGALVSMEQSGQLLDAGIDLVVRTAAIPEGNAEFQRATALGLRQCKYAELLGQVMHERVGIAVAGTHGKSTTTAMIAHALLANGWDPSFVVGGTVPQLGGGSRSGGGPVFVAEACEYDRSFHNLHPRIAVITNIEADHLDCYGSLEAIIESFHRFAGLVPGEGTIIANGDDANSAAALRGIGAPIETVGMPDADWSIRPLESGDGCARGEIFCEGQAVAELALAIAGGHNLMNAAMALAACAAVGLAPGESAAALNSFTGVDRRMTRVGEFNGATIIDDYGHHPTEIRATLSALRTRYRPRRLICVFQPHQFSRTRLLLDDFARSFVDADLTIITAIYAVRDSAEERAATRAEDLVDRIAANGQAVIHFPTFAEVIEHLRRSAQPGDLIVTMGAGTVGEIGRALSS
ncbi:MAG TPA: UDP-N-acetylmuramate--L-alanine ligase [Tepidisphaeraceae bacterium]|nr:UDP-N-acetylmuramate--L-alanine ligase [Tepidisphaeraceae bacterium]